MSEQKDGNAYRSIAKGTAMMGGVQVFNILINVIRGKLVAIFLGPTGMGISSLLNSTVNPIQQFSSLGLSLSIVKDVAELKGINNAEIHTHISVVRTLVYATALLGAVVTIIMAPYLSLWSFGDKSYTWHFVALSLMVFFTTCANGERSILQGDQALKRLAYSSLVGSMVGLIIGVPLYYMYGYDGIVPAMILLSLATYAFYRYHEYKIFKSSFIVSVDSIKKYLPLIKALISLGIISMIASLIGTTCNYAINAFVRYDGSVEDVGYFQAANSITNQYVALVFSAMSMDYFPRLAAVCNDDVKVRKIVNTQTEIVLLVISPIVSLMIIFAPLLIKLLLTDDFLVLQQIIRIFAFAVFFKALAYPMGYISFAKGDKKTFFWLEGIYGNIILTITSIGCYHYLGLIGLAIAITITYTLVLLSYYLITRRMYFYTPDRSVIALVFITCLLTTGCFVGSLIKNNVMSTCIMGIFSIISIIISVYGLEKRLNIIGLIKSKYK